MTTAKPKKLSAMDLLVKSDALKPAISQGSVLSRNAVTNLRNGVPVEVSPAACRPWKLADRPLAEAEHKAELVESFRGDGVGQLQPAILRPVKDADVPGIEYEVICGCVRWMAARELGIPLRAIVRELDDREAYAVMSVENRHRRNLSDWAKARSYRRTLELGIFAGAGQLAEAEGISKSRLSLYLGFAELPDPVAEAFGRIAQVSYRMGYAIARACKVLGAEALIGLVPKIEAGEITRDDLERMATPTVSAMDGGRPVGSEHDGESAESPDSEAGSGAAAAGETGRTAEEGDRQASEVPGESPGRESGGSAMAEPAGSARESWLRKTFVSSAGLKLFTYNQAARGWLIRIDPEVSMRIGEDLMRDIGDLIEARLRGAGMD